MLKTTVQISKPTREKLKEISDARKEKGTLPNKQTEILSELINGLHKREVK